MFNQNTTAQAPVRQLAPFKPNSADVRDSHRRLRALTELPPPPWYSYGLDGHFISHVTLTPLRPVAQWRHVANSRTKLKRNNLMNERAPAGTTEFISEHRQDAVRKIAAYAMFEDVMSEADGAEGNERLVKRDEQLAMVRSLYPLIMEAEV